VPEPLSACSLPLTREYVEERQLHADTSSVLHVPCPSHNCVSYGFLPKSSESICWQPDIGQRPVHLDLKAEIFHKQFDVRGAFSKRSPNWSVEECICYLRLYKQEVIDDYVKCLPLAANAHNF
jgi:hypothetical protein